MIRAARYPNNVALFDNLEALIDSHVLNGYQPTEILADGRPVVTQGSCFAHNVARSLARNGAKVAHLNVNEFINTTYANLAFFMGAAGEPHPGAAELKALFSANKGFDMQAFEASVKEAAAFIFTIGVAPIWYHKQSNLPSIAPSRYHLREFEMRTSSVEENRDNILATLQRVRRINPDISIFLTLSPAPLDASNEFASALVADCVSKSVLRIAIHEVMKKQLPKVTYWPSFEIVRWVGSHLGPVYGAEDQHPRHVSNWIVDVIVRKFMTYNGGAALLAKGESREADMGEPKPFVLHKNY